MDPSLSLPVFFSAIGAAAGVLLQQAIDVWKTRVTHRQELQRRFFDLKLKTAIDLAQALDALVASHQARLHEAVERTRDDENFSGLAVSRQVVRLHGEALEKRFHDYFSAFSVLELVFSQHVVEAVVEAQVSLELIQAWREFDDRWQNLVRTLNDILPEERIDEFRKQREQGRYDEKARSEMENWITTYKARNSELRELLPNLVILTTRAEEHRRSVLRVIRKEMSAYAV